MHLSYHGALMALIISKDSALTCSVFIYIHYLVCLRLPTILRRPNHLLLELMVIRVFVAYQHY